MKRNPLVILISDKKRGGLGAYVGRPSPLGNPLVLKDENEREKVMRRPDRWSLPVGAPLGAATPRSSRSFWPRPPGSEAIRWRCATSNAPSAPG